MAVVIACNEIPYFVLNPRRTPRLWFRCSCQGCADRFFTWPIPSNTINQYLPWELVEIHIPNEHKHGECPYIQRSSIDGAPPIPAKDFSLHRLRVPLAKHICEYLDASRVHETRSFGVVP